MKKSEIVIRVNKLIKDGLYTYNDMKIPLDDAIDRINQDLNAKYPEITSVLSDVADTADYNLFPEKYIRAVVIPYVVGYLLRSDEEEYREPYQAAMLDYEQGASIMFRDFFNLVPEEYQETSGGYIAINPNAVTEDEEPTLYDPFTVR